jgi:hypothetical protein
MAFKWFYCADHGLVINRCNISFSFFVSLQRSKPHLGINSFYAPETHIMYLAVSSSFLISFVMGGGERPEQGD